MVPEPPAIAPVPGALVATALAAIATVAPPPAHLRNVKDASGAKSRPDTRNDAHRLRICRLQLADAS